MTINIYNIYNCQKENVMCSGMPNRDTRVMRMKDANDIAVCLLLV